MSKKILWLDNDPAYLDPYVEALTEAGYHPTVVTTVSAAEQKLRADKYDLLLLDVMIPTKSESEEHTYSPEKTDSGLKTGLIFYQQMKEMLDQSSTSVLVMTVRLDSGIYEEFKKSGLDPENFCTKMSLRQTPVFIKKIKLVLKEKEA